MSPAELLSGEGGRLNEIFGLKLIVIHISLITLKTLDDFVLEFYNLIDSTSFELT